jgi:capsular exopolysaccharide synthesis family protein
VSTTSSAATSSLITLTDARSPASEAYRTLRSNIQFCSLDKPVCTILVTGVEAGEGKSTTLANLAVVMAQGGKRVTVMDCDLRRPTLHKIFGLPSEPGLTTAILEKTGRAPTQKTAIDGLSLVASGQLPPNPSELLGSHRFDEILGALAKEADIVLLDAPPIIAVSDAALLASKVDGVILVVNAGKTKRDLARRARTLLEKANARILGVVLNNAAIERSLYTY